VQSLFDIVDKWFVRILSAVIFITFSALVVLVTMQIYVRFFTTSSLTWSEELSTYIMIWMVLMASILVFRNKGHIWVENVIDILPAMVKPLVLAVSNVFVLVFYVIIIWGAITLLPTVHSQLSSACKIPMSYLYFAMPFSMVLTIFYIVRHIYDEVTEFIKAE
jgi:TRAP-type C4-dicarboxylate transport system permease small subunit